MTARWPSFFSVFSVLVALSRGSGEHVQVGDIYTRTRYAVTELLMGSIVRLCVENDSC